MKKIFYLFILGILLFLTNPAFAQNTFFQGRIVDLYTHDPLEGVTIQIKNGAEGVITDDKGEFTIQAGGETVLLLSLLGYQPKEYTIFNMEEVVTIQMESSNIALNEVQVLGYNEEMKSLYTAGSIGLVTLKDFQRNNGIHLQNTINLIPGVKMEMRTVAAGTRIVLRGYGNQTNFNGVGYKAYLNGIPLTDADGTTSLDDVDFNVLGRAEIIKGPGSSLYGNTIGGVVNLYTERTPAGKSSVSQSAMVGSNELYRFNTTLRVGGQKSSILINYGRQNYTGFRKHGQSNKDFFTFNGDFYINEKYTVSAYASYTYSYDLLSGQTDSLELRNSPEIAEQAYISNNANIKTESSRFGITQEYKFTPEFSNKTTIFLVNTIIDQPFAAGWNKTSKFKVGLRSVFTYTPSFGDRKLRLLAGTELLKGINYQKSYALSNGVLGAIRSDLETLAGQYSIFGQAEFDITPKTFLTVGASYNMLEYSIDDLRIGTPGVTANNNGYKSFAPVITPRASLTQLLFNDNVSVYASYSQGYSAPGLTQVVIPAINQVNKDLKPEFATSYEIGSKGSLFNKAFSYEIAAFMMNVDNKLVSQNFPAANGFPQYTSTVNAGTTQHNGLEVALSYSYQPREGSFISLIKPFVTYTYSDFYYKSFKSDNNNNAATIDYTGKKLSGIAPHLFNAGLDIQTKIGLYAYITCMYVDKMPVVLNNSYSADAYTLLNSKIGYRGDFGKRISLDVYAGSDNMLSSVYASHIFINLQQVAGVGTKFYNPMPKITFYSGISLKYNF